MTTAFFSHADCRRHDMGPGHPECPARLAAIEDHFLATGLADVLVRHDDAPQARAEDLAHAHASNYLSELDETFALVAEAGRLVSVDPDTAACPHTRQAALRAAGAAVAATDLVLDGRAENAFCAVRPPGLSTRRISRAAVSESSTSMIPHRHSTASTSAVGRSIHSSSSWRNSKPGAFSASETGGMIFRPFFRSRSHALSATGKAVGPCREIFTRA